MKNLKLNILMKLDYLWTASTNISKFMFENHNHKNIVAIGLQIKYLVLFIYSFKWFCTFIEL